jgi:hypothetical protein
MLNIGFDIWDLEFGMLENWMMGQNEVKVEVKIEVRVEVQSTKIFVAHQLTGINIKVQSTGTSCRIDE